MSYYTHITKKGSRLSKKIMYGAIKKNDSEHNYSSLESALEAVFLAQTLNHATTASTYF